MKNIRAVIDIYRKIAYVLTKKQKVGAMYSFIAMVVCSLLELLGVSAIYPFLQLIIDEDSFRTKWYVRFIYSIAPGINSNQTIVLFCLLIILVFIVKNVMALVCTYIQTRYAERLRKELSLEVFRSYMRRPYEIFVNTSTGNIMRGVRNGPTVINSIVLSLFQFVSEAMTSVLIGIYLLSLDIRIAVATIVLALLCFFTIVIGFKKKIKIMGKQLWELDAKSFSVCSQTFDGVKEIIVMNRRKYFSDRYEETLNKNEKINVAYGFLSACPDRVLEGICMSGFLGIVSVRILMGVEINSFISTLGVFVMGAFKILPSISKMSSRVNTVVFQLPALTDCYDNIRHVREPNTSVGSDAYKKNQEESDKYDNSELKSEIREMKDCLCAHGLVWHYANSARFVLNGLDFVVHKGEAVALIGESGAGKTTLSDILLGLYSPQNGKVLVDGVDIYSIPEAWSQMIGYVPQSVFLVDDTVRANIAFGIPEDRVEDERIWDVLKQSKLDTFIHELPKGLDTIVGDRGLKFSGGQRQRIAIARALYNDPQIMVLDEATSALDSETEKGVMDAIDSLQGSKTLIIVAHRLSTIKNCDRIYEIVDGKALERSKSEVLKRI